MVPQILGNPPKRVHSKARVFNLRMSRLKGFKMERSKFEALLPSRPWGPLILASVFKVSGLGLRLLYKRCRLGNSGSRL